jgi:hypothetical protein
VWTEELETQNNILDAGMILNLLREGLVVPQKRGGMAMRCEILVFRLWIFGTLYFVDILKLGTNLRAENT